MDEIKIVWTKASIYQRNLIFEYWNNRNGNKNYSKKINLEFKRKLKQLVKFPEIGIQIENYDLRSIFYNQYSIIYKFKDKTIAVISIWDNRQNPERLLKLLKENK